MNNYPSSVTERDIDVVDSPMRCAECCEPFERGEARYKRDRYFGMSDVLLCERCVPRCGHISRVGGRLVTCHEPADENFCKSHELQVLREQLADDVRDGDWECAVMHMGDIARLEAA